MNSPYKQHRYGPIRPQAGFTMIEVLITMLIISLALLGTSGVHVYAMRLNKNGQFRTQAVILSADLAERMEGNKPGALAGNYVLATSSTAMPDDTGCLTATCTANSLAAFDLAQWTIAVAAALPQASWSVAQTVAGNPSTYTITVSWVDRAENTTNAAYDATSSVGSNATGTGERFSYTATRVIFN